MKKNEKTAVYQTILVLSVAGLLAFWWWDRTWVLFVVLGLMGSALLAYPIARYIHFLWMGVGKTLGWINTRILLGLVYFLLLWPLAMLRRIFKKPVIHKQFEESSDTYFRERKEPVKKESFEELW